MKHKIDSTRVYEIVWGGILILVCLIAVAYVLLRVWVVFAYGDIPITELPAWVWWLMQSGGNK